MKGFYRFGIVIMFCWSGLMTIESVRGTPPTPPAQLKFPDAEKLEALKPQDGTFIIPLRVVSTADVTELSIQVQVKQVVLLDPNEIVRQQNIIRRRGAVSVSLPSRRQARDLRESAEQKYPVKGGGEFKVSVPILKEAGIYRIDIELSGKLDEKSGILDRFILYQVVSEGRERLITSPEFRRMQNRQRKDSFYRALKEKPEEPDIRLLSPDTVKIPRRISKRIKLYEKRPELIVQGAGPSPEFRPYIVDKTNQDWDARDPITVRGQITFCDFEGTWRPLVNVSVNLYDDDTFGDEHLGTTVTDWNGNWSFSVNNADGFLQNGRDIYYKFHLGNTRWHVRDSSGDDYVWKSAVHDDLSDGTVLDFGAETGSTDPESMQIFSVINLGWNHIVTAGGQDPGHVEIRFPESTTAFSPSSEKVKIEMQYNDGPDVTLHEYGHALMHKAFGGTNISPGGAHSFGEDKQDKGLAYSEGWATGYMLSVFPDGAYNWHEGNTEAAGEWPTCSVQNDPGRDIELFSDTGNRVGEENEGRVAAAINDFRDPPNDDNGGSENRGRNNEEDANVSNRVSLATIYRDNMWGYVHNDFLKFWISLAGDLSGTTSSQAGDIMQYNWMSIPIEVSCAATKVTVAKRSNHADLLSGLRYFRDHALKPLPSGRRMIQSYYSHSPQLAMLIIRNPKAREAALVIIEHFSKLGYAFANNKALKHMLDSNILVIPPNVETAISTVTEVIKENGSDDLQREIVLLRQVLDEYKGVSIRVAVNKLSSIDKADTGQIMTVVNPHMLAPGGPRVDWDLIRKNLPDWTEQEGRIKDPNLPVSIRIKDGVISNKVVIFKSDVQK